jgi:hypothetical protein
MTETGYGVAHHDDDQISDFVSDEQDALFDIEPTQHPGSAHLDIADATIGAVGPVPFPPIPHFAEEYYTRLPRPPAVRVDTNDSGKWSARTISLGPNPGQKPDFQIVKPRGQRGDITIVNYGPGTLRIAPERINSYDTLNTVALQPNASRTVRTTGAIYATYDGNVGTACTFDVTEEYSEV